jgi:hypothetical protein
MQNLLTEFKLESKEHIRVLPQLRKEKLLYVPLALVLRQHINSQTDKSNCYTHI